MSLATRIDGSRLDRLNALLEEVLPANRFQAARLGSRRKLERPEDYFALPLLTKQELAADGAAHPPFGTNLTHPLERYTRYHQTSGTTGAPLRVLDTPETWDWWGRCWGAVLRAAGVTPKDRLFFAFSFAPSIGFWSAFHGATMLGALCIPAGGASSRQRLRMILASEATVLLATPTFYQGWMRRIEPPAFASVRLAVVGAEKLRPSLASAWRERFGQELFEGYGCTELSPVVSVNLPRRAELAGAEEAARAGSVGRPLPGVAVRIVDAESGEPLPPEHEGRVRVYGASVMAGYLDEPERTAEVLCGGWYDTGDLAPYRDRLADLERQVEAERNAAPLNRSRAGEPGSGP